MKHLISNFLQGFTRRVTMQAPHYKTDNVIEHANITWIAGQLEVKIKAKLKKCWVDAGATPDKFEKWYLENSRML